MVQPQKVMAGVGQQESREQGCAAQMHLLEARESDGGVRRVACGDWRKGTTLLARSRTGGTGRPGGNKQQMQDGDFVPRVEWHQKPHIFTKSLTPHRMAMLPSTSTAPPTPLRPST